MSVDSLGLGTRTRPARGQGVEHVQVQRPLRRILAFTGQSIDQVINNPFSRNLVYGYWKLYKQIERSSEVVELEQAWNPARL